MAKFPGNTIQLSDTADQWGRKVHINVRNEKVTLVYRWKSRKDDRKHTQRITLDDQQAARLLASVAIAAAVVCENRGGAEALNDALQNHASVLAKKSGL
ncbi:inhibitor of toxin/antitoxin system [Pectobacterium phage Q19]|uniref:Inhibitor of toxin/antitoxin system n=1 Tax=Pectobacterium phage Q19 TaxID=2500576 RepID=A0A678ZZP8_9CAUD|nr:inhibitor of toxin/antitoxin system [Pectobacterium phage Q19]